MADLLSLNVHYWDGSLKKAPTSMIVRRKKLEPVSARSLSRLHAHRLLISDNYTVRGRGGAEVDLVDVFVRSLPHSCSTHDI